MFLDYLFEVKKIGEFVAVYFGSEKFYFGKIAAVNDELVVIQSYPPYGEDDGFIIKRVDEITGVECKSKYNEKLKRIIKAKNTVHSNIAFADDGFIETAIKASQSKRKVVSLELSFSDVLVYGIVKSINYPLCVIDQFDEYGEADGEISFSIEQINSLFIDTQDEVNINLLITANS